MKISVLVENNISGSALVGLNAQHGLSMLIESAGKTILLDTGCDDLFIRNAELMDINLETVDLLVLSHGHYDHGGGLRDFLEMNEKASVYLHKKAFGDYYSIGKSEVPRYVGLDKKLLSDFEIRFHFIEKDGWINENIKLICGFENRYHQPEGNRSLFKKVKDELLQDDFEHELALEIKEEDQQYLFSPCSHNGILNIIEKGDEPDYVFAGLHLKDRDTVDYGLDRALSKVVKALDQTSSVFYLAHCTGRKAFGFIKSHSEKDIHSFATGDIFRFK